MPHAQPLAVRLSVLRAWPLAFGAVLLSDATATTGRGVAEWADFSVTTLEHLVRKEERSLGDLVALNLLNPADNCGNIGRQLRAIALREPLSGGGTS